MGWSDSVTSNSMIIQTVHPSSIPMVYLSLSIDPSCCILCVFAEENETMGQHGKQKNNNEQLTRLLLMTERAVIREKRRLPSLPQENDGETQDEWWNWIPCRSVCHTVTDIMFPERLALHQLLTQDSYMVYLNLFLLVAEAHPRAGRVYCSKVKQSGGPRRKNNG